jgi:4-hydroxyacetophenone monooxygenase
MSARPALLTATDAEIEDAIGYAEPMLLRGLMYQLTADPKLLDMEVEFLTLLGRYGNRIKDEANVAYVRKLAADWLKDYRDRGAPHFDIGDPERLFTAMRLCAGGEMLDEDRPIWMEQTCLDPWVRGLKWKKQPTKEQIAGFKVGIVGAGMSGLNVAVHLKRAGIAFTVIEKNEEVGGTWFENRYPGARVDSPSRLYSHKFGAAFPYEYSYCPQDDNLRYNKWIADNWGFRENIKFNTEVDQLVWNEDDSLWEAHVTGPNGPEVLRFNVVFSAVGLLSRPSMPKIEGMDTFEGVAVHTAMWPDDLDVTGKRVAVIGSGASGYQTTPVMAKIASHLTLFQRTPSWCFDNTNYLSALPPQIPWLETNFPYYLNFVRTRLAWSYGPEGSRAAMYLDPNFDDPNAGSARNKKTRDERVAFIQKKLAGRPDLIEKMIPKAPVFSSRPIQVDANDSVYDAILRDNVTLVSDTIERITPKGIVAGGVEHEFDVIVYATGFKANDVLAPMEVRGRGGRSIHELWKKDGPRAYIGSMAPGFPNFFMSYGPNTNNFGGFHTIDVIEIMGRFALDCIAELITSGKKSIDVTQDAYDRFNTELDREEKGMMYMDKRVKNYYTNDFGRSCVNNPIDFRRLWRWLRDPTSPSNQTDAGVRPYFGEDLKVA